MSTETVSQRPMPRVISEELSIFIDRLAETIVMDVDFPSCSMCAIGLTCEQKVNDLTCQNAIKAWLLAKAGEYLTHNLKEANEMEEYFSYLEELRESGATNMFGATPYLQEHFPELRHDSRRAHEILQAWMDSYKEDSEC